MTDSPPQRLSWRLLDRATRFSRASRGTTLERVDSRSLLAAVDSKRSRSESNGLRSSIKKKFKEVTEVSLARSKSLKLPSRSNSPQGKKRQTRAYSGVPATHPGIIPRDGTPASLHAADESPVDLYTKASIYPLQSTPAVARSASNMADVEVPLLLQQGTPLTKISAKKQKTMVFRLDPDQGQILWESKKPKIIPIENIKEIRTCSDARFYREQFRLAQEYEDRWLTIVYILDGQYKTLHLIASTRGVFQIWDTTLRKLYAIRRELMSGIGNIEMRQAVWEKQYWKGADQEGDQYLNFDDVERLCKRLNINSSTDNLRHLFQQADKSNTGFLNFTDFQRFVKLLKARPELDELYNTICSWRGGRFDFGAFERFMRDCQKSCLSQAELERIFTKYASTPLDPQTPPASSSSLPPSDTAPETTSSIVSGQNAPDAPQATSSSSAIAPSLLFSPCPIRLTTPVPLSASPTSLLATSQPSASSELLASSESLASSEFPPTTVHATTHSTSHPPLISTLDHQHLPSQTLDTNNWTLEGFTAFLLSTDNSAFTDQDGEIVHDMTRPLSEYYISSSHNTYLVGHQLVGVSTIEGYIRALLHSCRSVEVDIYDGDTEPMIYHGKTFTSKVSLRKVCQAIAKYAFVTSPYPIIISAEVHCSLAQQDLIVGIMHEVFGDILVSAPLDSSKTIEVLPSPEDLRGRVLLKAKNLYVSESEGIHNKELTVDTESSSTETSESEVVQDIKYEWRKAKGSEPVKELKEEFQRARNALGRHVAKHRPHSPSHPGTSAIVIGPTSTAFLKPPTTDQPDRPPKVKMSFALASLLVYTVGVKCRGLNKKEHYAPQHLFSLSESTANKIFKQSMTDLIKHNRTHLVRIYPKGTRLNSTNYEPHRYWSAGAQLVAINWQTFDLGYMINHAMFQRNGRSGYVLKPQALRVVDKHLLVERTKHFLDVTVISAQQLPRLKDSLGHEIIDKSMVDPFVEVSIHVPDWTHFPFLPEAVGSDTTYTPASTSTATSATAARTVAVRTGVVRNNGFNPKWSEELSLPFDCVGDMKDLIFVRFSVRQEGKSDEDEPLAVYCTSLGSLQQGFRHLPLHDAQLSQYLFSTLFVQINMREA